MISPYEHKKDTIRPHNEGTDGSWVNVNVGGAAPNTFVLFSPTARPRVPRPTIGTFAEPDYGRSQKDIFFKGYSERMTVFANSSFMWRRIVFWSYYRDIAALNTTGTPEGSPGVRHNRQLTPYTNDQDMRDWLFKGTQGVDWTTDSMIMAPVNKDMNNVVMDKTYNINVKDSTDFTMINKKHYYPGGRISYDDYESGTKTVSTSPWAAGNFRSSMGNMYILDIFSDAGGRESSQQAGRFTCQGVTYINEP